VNGKKETGDRTLYLVDGTANLFRAFHAIRQLSNSDGLPTNAVFGFTSMLRKLIKTFEPAYLAVAFDLAGPTFRHEMYEKYKANRAETPEELIAQIPWVKRVCAVLNAAIVEMEGFEADDLIGTLAHKASRAGFQVVVVASDKDLLQLVGEGIRVFNPVSERLLDSDGVEQRFGAEPGQVPDVLALWGDSSDNIPGVPGIGEKGAKQLIRRFGTLEGVLSGAAEVERKSYREGLLQHADSARLSLRLATLRLDVPIEFDPETFRLHPPEPEVARGLFRELEFGALEREFAAPVQAPAGRHEIVHESERLREAVEKLRNSGAVGLKVDCDHQEPMRAEPLGLTLAGESGEAFYIPIVSAASGSERCIDGDEVMRLAAPLLEDDNLRRTGHDAKSDLVLLRSHGYAVGRFDFDSMLASYLLNSSRRDHAIEAVASEAAGLEVPSLESLLGTGAGRIPLAEVEMERRAAFACSRLSAVMAVRRRQLADLDRDGLLSLLTDMELPLTGILAEMERRGVGIDGPFLEQLSAGWQTELDRLTETIHELAGREFNLNSPKQLADILFNILKLQPGRRTRTAPRVSQPAEAQVDLRRCAAEADQSAHRQSAHFVQSGGRRDRTTEQQRSKSAKYSDPVGAWPADPPRLHPHAGAHAAVGRLLPDRAARAGPSLPRSRSDRRVREGGGHPSPHRRGAVRRHAGSGDGRDASPRQSGEFRDYLRNGAAATGARTGGDYEGSDRVHPALLRAVSDGEGLRGRHHRRGGA
jgi:DNA polymerase-1